MLLTHMLEGIEGQSTIFWRHIFCLVAESIEFRPKIDARMIVDDVHDCHRGT